jgi:CheY-like chemotaxis protein
VFTLVLPLDCRAVPDAPVGPHPAAARAGERLVLCVDDDPAVAPLLQKMLAGHGYRVVGARGASAAVEAARALQPAVILVDLRLSAHDGTELLRDLKDDPSTSGMPVILVSVVDPGDLPDEVDGYLRKPVQQAPLVQLLEERVTAPKAPL